MRSPTSILALFLLAVVLTAAPAAHAQAPVPNAAGTSEATADVRATIDALFDAMRAADSSGVRAVFTTDARLQTALAGDAGTQVRTTSIDRFVEVVGQPKDAVWDERIWDVAIRVDGPLASAWTPYAFYRGDALSHCGVNAIQFVRIGDVWKIQQLIDTRHPADTCTLPDAVTSPDGDM